MIGALLTVAKALAVCFAALHRHSVPPTVPLPTGGPVPRLRLTEERPVHTWPRTITKGQTATIFWCNANASEVLVEQASGRRCPPASALADRSFSCEMLSSGVPSCDDHVRDQLCGGAHPVRGVDHHNCTRLTFS